MKRTKRTIVATIAALLVIASSTPPASAAEAGAPAAESPAPARISFPGEIRYHGLLPGIPGAAVTNRSARVIAVDDKRRRMYVMYDDISNGFGPAATTVLNTYDLAPRGIPSLLKSRVIEGGGIGFGGDRQPYSVVYDAGRQQVLFSTTGNDGASVQRLDVRGAKVLPAFNVTAEVPGFSAVGMTYSAEDDRLYLLGDMSGSAVVGELAKLSGAARSATAMIALDADTGTRVWARPVPECQQPLVTFVVGSLVARSELRDALYFFCHSGGTTSFANEILATRYPGQSALLRLNIDGAASQQDAAQFTTDIFPVSGSYQLDQNTGIGAFDPKTDRFIVQSRAPRTPGAWVFDGRLDAWVGFITAPDGNNSFLAVNPRTGRHYMGGQVDAGKPVSNAYVNIADIRLSPVPQGQTVPLVDGTGLGSGGLARIALDPATQRLFPNRIGPDAQIAVIEDTTPLQTVDDTIDYDSLTSDSRITPQTPVQYSGGTAGYGANIRLAGGAAAGFSGVPGFVGREILRPNGVDGSPPCASAGVDDVSCVSGGDRQLTVGAVPAIDLRNSGASAQATALEADSNTDAERDGMRRVVKNRTDGSDDGPASALNPVFGRVDCLDGGGDRQSRTTSDKPMGTARVTCDLAKNIVEATSAFGDLAGEAVALSSSTFDTRSALALNRRSITESTADARGVRIGPSTGTHVTIGAVQTVAATVAGGRPGTTLARWERSLSGVRVQEGDGTESFASPGCSTVIEAAGGKTPALTESGNCNELIAQLNAALKGRAELRLPQPEITATPKGAFAAINKTQRDFLQASTLQNDDRKAIPGLEAIVFNDGEEKSRLVVQLAGVQANSIFLISNFGAPEPWVDEDPVPTGSSDTGDGNTGNADTAGAGGGGGNKAGGSGPGVGADQAPSLDDTGSAPPADDLPSAPAVAGGLAATDVLATPIPQRIASGLRWLARSPGEAALVGGMWLLFAAAVAATVRRCLLLRHLQV